MLLYRLNPPAVTTIRESAPRVMVLRNGVAPDVVLRNAPQFALVPTPYRFSANGRTFVAPYCRSSVAFVPTFTMTLAPTALVLRVSWTVPFSIQIAPLKELSFVSTAMLSCFTARPPLPDSTPPSVSVFWFAPYALIQ